VLVADADNQAGDPNLDQIGQLLTASLEQSRRLAVLPRSRLEAVARDARLGDLARVDAGAARELGRLAGADLLLLPAIRRDGAGLRVELRASSPRDGRPRFALSEQARDAAEVPAVLDRLAVAARRKLRERADDLQAGRIQVALAFSPNLEATRAYFDGLDCLRRTDDPGGPLDLSCPPHFERALAHDPSFALAHYRLALAETPWGAPPERGRPHIDAAMRAVDRLPAREGALVRAWEAHLSGRDEEALRRYDELLVRFPDDAEALERAASLVWFQGRFAESVPYLQRRLALDPGDDQARLDLVAAFGMLGRAGELRRLVAEAKALPPAPHRARALVEGLVRLGELDEAVALARAAARDMPSPPTRGALSLALEMSGRFGELEAVRRAALGEDANRWYALADAVAAQGRFREAEAILVEASRRDERRDQRLATHVRAVWLGDGREPAGFWREAARSAALDPSTAGTLAVLAALRGDLPHAAVLARATPPGSNDLEQYEALVAWRGGDATGALARLAALQSRDPEPVSGIHPSYLTAEVAVAARDWQEALGALERFQRQPVKGYWSAWAWPRAHLLRARAHLALGQRGAAHQALDRLLDIYQRADADLSMLREARALRAGP
jgi:tetratricopeptide (TPR) repeat protein